VFCLVNVTSSTEVDAAFVRSRAAIGQQRIPFTCAGVGGSAKTVSRYKTTGEIRQYPLENFERIIQVNLNGFFGCITRSEAGMLTLDRFEDGDRGVIINIASVAADDGQIGQAVYSASTAGLVGMTLTVARDLSSECIRVNKIPPGIFDTSPGRAPEAVKAGLAAQVPFPKCLGRPDEFALLAHTIITCGCTCGSVNSGNVRLDGAIRMTPHRDTNSCTGSGRLSSSPPSTGQGAISCFRKACRSILPLPVLGSSSR
jgi:NAD(P)-dependent dehydrogenase (short-subunit alcohol dehydrogenase family)